jgi:hypothetical protein
MSSPELEPQISHSEGSSVLEVMREDGTKRVFFSSENTSLYLRDIEDNKAVNHLPWLCNTVATLLVYFLEHP